MAINFPNTVGQLTDGSFKHTHGDRTWSWNGESWIVQLTTETPYTDSDVDTHLNQDGNIPDGKILSWDANANGGLGDYSWIDAPSGGTQYTNSDVDTHLNKDASSDGKVLSWDAAADGGSGAYAWVDQPTVGTQYTDSDVNTHLNQDGNISDGYVLSWDAAADNDNGDYAWIEAPSGGGSSLWSENGSELYRNSQVGIGDFSSTAPSAKLHVQAVSNEPALNCGNNNTSSGAYSIAIGKDCQSTSVYSIAMGRTARAWSKYSIAIGNEDTATNTSSTANVQNGEYSIAIGNWAITKGKRSLAFGNEVTSGGNKATAMGHKMASLGTYSFGIGLNNVNHSVGQSSTMAIMGGKVAIDTSTTLDNGIYTLDDITEKLEVGGAIKIGTTSTALPTGGEIKYDSNDFFGHDGTEWKSLTSGGGGGGTLSSRTTIDTNTDMTTTDSKTLTVGASASGYITGFKSYSLLKINISQPDLWVTIYTDPNSMSNDASRLYTQDPNPSSGVIAEFITDSNNSGQDIIITPTVIGFNAESTPSDKIYLKVSNIGSSNQTSDFIIQMTVLQLEA